VSSPPFTPSGSHPSAETFIGLLEPLKRPLLAYCSKSLQRGCDREDALQTAVTTAFSSFASFQLGTNFTAWMFKHLFHAVANLRRRSQDTVALDGDRDHCELQMATTDQLSMEMAYHHLLSNPEMLYDQFDSHIAAALRVLSEDERSILLLRSIGGLTYREISEIRAVPVGTIMSHLSRSRQKMRERLTLSATGARMGQSLQQHAPFGDSR
jgi:RNA polymerase sigma-70 factor (ECF subfamily)